VGITCLGILLAAAVSALHPRIYQSRAFLEIQGLNDTYLNLRDVYPAVGATADAAGYVQTQADILSQRNLLEDVARKLHLESNPNFRSSRGAVEQLRRDIRVLPSRNSRTIQIICDARSAALAADLCNTLAQSFIDESIEARQLAARQTYDSLKPQLDELRAAMVQSESRAAMSAAARTRGGAPADAVIYRRFYEAALEKVGNAWLASRVHQTNIRQVGVAEPPTRPYKPNLPLNLALGTLAGLILAVAFVLLQAQNHSVLREPGEAGMHLTLPELGAIPKAPAMGRLTLRITASGNGRPRVERAALEQRSSGVSESFRATLASILSASRNGAHPRTLVVTSARPTEGKTTVVSNLGIALAEISNKVLLIDGDMRRPRLHKIFDEPNSWGLSDVLGEKNAIDDLPLDVLVKKTAVPHVYLLPSGTCPENIFGLLCAGRLSKLLPRFREEFDYVLVDAPPCLEFADVRIMAQYADELLLVVRANHTHRKTAQAAVDRLRLDGIPLMGVILNRWDPAHSTAYDYPESRVLSDGVL
jgi:receptor protein-tyrosine kinase